jgi:phosphoenolpyruvate synthase/pyruvate phosphate dikinase
MTTTERQATDRIAWFSELDRDDVALVGGTSVNLGELTVPDCRYQNASSFTAAAYVDARRRRARTPLGHRPPV